MCCPSFTISITLKIPSFSTTVPDAVPRSLQLVEEDKTASIPSLNIDFILFLLQDPGFEETNQGNGGGKVGPTFRLLACREISTMKFNAIKLFSHVGCLTSWTNTVNLRLTSLKDL